MIISYLDLEILPLIFLRFTPRPLISFRLWQVYLNNVDPLLKVTHTPSLQGRIIDAASDIHNIESPLEALMFSIYCISIASLEANDCLTMFGLSQDNLLIKYHFGCQQALMNAGFIRSENRDSLTALYLYLLSVRSGASPRSRCSMFGIAMRIAQCIGIHNESPFSKYSVFESEMRRRLWWSLMLYDTRRSEMADYKDLSLAPTWSCKVPCNLNDSEMRAEMREPLVASGKVTEAIFVVVRSELADFVRHSPSHLEFLNPALKPIAKPLPHGGSFAALEKRIEEDYLRFCDPENPIHFMTIWTARSYIAKSQLLDHYTKFSNGKIHQTDTERDFAMSLAFKMLDCDTKIMTSPLTKGYLWFMQSYFPFPAYMHVIQDLRRRPLSGQAERAWEVMGHNYDVRFPPPGPNIHPLFRMFGRTVLLAWEAVEAALKPELPSTTPKIVISVKEREARTAQTTQKMDSRGQSGVENIDVERFLSSMSMGFSGNDRDFNMDDQKNSVGTSLMDYTTVHGQALFNFETDQCS